MSQNKTASCVDIVSCLTDDHDALRQQLAVLRSPSRATKNSLEDFLARLKSHASAEEEVLFSRALEINESCVGAMQALEEHELAATQAERVRQSADSVQWQARLNVLADLVERNFEAEEERLFPELASQISEFEREELGMRYREVKDRNELAPVLEMPVRESLLANETGRVGYIIAWLLGVPVWLLLLVFLVRGH